MGATIVGAYVTKVVISGLCHQQSYATTINTNCSCCGVAVNENVRRQQFGVCVDQNNFGYVLPTLQCVYHHQCHVCVISGLKGVLPTLAV